MRIGELETRTGLSRHTLRYYEQQGLLGKIDRDGNNYRNYTEAFVRDLHLVKQMQTLGFSLVEIREVLQGLRSRGINCAQGAQLLGRKRARINEQIAKLRTASRLLAKEQKRLEARARRYGLPAETPR
jgi:DNA-binding transcriptional MerR regulator